MRIQSTGVPLAATAANPRLHQAATQFESMLLKDLLKPLARGLGDAGEAEQEAGPLQSFATEAVAGQMARSGALGFARQIEQTLARTAAKKFSGMS